MSDSTSTDRPRSEGRSLSIKLEEALVLKELSNVSSETKQKVASAAKIVAESLEKAK
jgi:hypothetical protein